MIARLQPFLFDRLTEGDGDRSSRGIAVLLHVNEDPFDRKPQFLGRGEDDPQIRLVGNEEVDIIGGQFGGADRFLGGFTHDAGGETKDFSPPHLHEVKPTGHRIQARRLTTPSGGHYKELTPGSIGSQDEGEQPSRGIAGLEE